MDVTHYKIIPASQICRVPTLTTDYWLLTTFLGRLKLNPFAFPYYLLLATYYFFGAVKLNPFAFPYYLLLATYYLLLFLHLSKKTDYLNKIVYFSPYIQKKLEMCS